MKEGRIGGTWRLIDWVWCGEENGGVLVNYEVSSLGSFIIASLL